MRKLILNIIGIVCLSLLIPIIFTKKFNIEAGNIGNNAIETEVISSAEEEKYDYSNFSTIKVLHQDTGEVEEMELDQYLLGVVAAEMPASYELEALKAQALVARTYTLYKIINGTSHEGSDICDSYLCCQAWISKEKRFEKWEEGQREDNWNKICKAVNETKGKIITYNGQVIDAFFHSNSGGVTEIPVNVWGGTDFPYLQAVETSGEDAYTQYSSKVELTKEEVQNKIKEVHRKLRNKL